MIRCSKGTMERGLADALDHVAHRSSTRRATPGRWLPGTTAEEYVRE